jgi:putative oxidoreductase
MTTLPPVEPEPRDADASAGSHREAPARAAASHQAAAPAVTSHDAASPDSVGLASASSDAAALDAAGIARSSIVTSPWLTLRVQIALGVIFVVASLPKIVDPPSFAHMIYNYRLGPGPFVNLMGLVMPWIELLCGLALILGIWRTTARTMIAFLLALFIVAISVNLARGNSIDCGCFDVTAAGKTTAERLADMKFVILRDLGMLLLVAQLWWADRRTAPRE